MQLKIIFNLKFATILFRAQNVVLLIQPKAIL